MKHLSSFFSRYALWCIFFVALLLRITKLGSLPANLHEDEILSGYVGRYILSNGKDLYNNSWPLLYFNKFGDYYIILPMYLKGLFTFIFGVNAFAIRFPTALLGALAVFPVYSLARWVTKNKTIALLSAGVLAVTPWHIVMSRASAEGVVGSTLFLYAVVFLLSYLDSRSTRQLALSALFFLISYFIYHPFRILAPLALLPCAFLVPAINHNRSTHVLLIILTIMSFSLTLYMSSTPWGSGRFAQTSIFSGLSGVQIKLDEFIFDEGTNNILTAKVFHNKVIGFGREFVRQYTSYFSFDYLFLNGGKSYAYRVPEQGLYLMTFAGLAVLAVIRIIGQLSSTIADNKRWTYLLFLLLIAPLPSGMTVLDGPNVHRSVFMSLILAIFMGTGLHYAMQLQFKKISLAAVLIVVATAEFIYFGHQYSAHADYFNALYRNDAQKQLIGYITTEIPSSTPIVMPVQNTMPLYYLFYTNDFDRSYASRFQLNIRIDSIHNIRFIDGECPSAKLNRDILAPDTIFIDSHACETDLGMYEQIATVTGENSLLAYKILRKKQL